MGSAKCRFLCKVVAALSRFWQVKALQLLCLPAVLIFTYTYRPLGLRDPVSGTIIDPDNATNTEAGFILIDGYQRPLVASNSLQILCLTISRLSGFSVFPVVILVFLSKCKAMCNFVDGTLFSMFFFKDLHKLHIYCGQFIAFDVWLHGLSHIVRWINAGTIHLLWTTSAGKSGLAALCMVPLITFPMMYFKQSLSYETRKLLHYLFVPFAIVLCFHAPAAAVPQGGYLTWVMGGCICVYFLDSMYISLFMTEKVETTLFHVLPSGVQMTFEASQRFQNNSRNGGYVYVCLPWITRSQWHAFSLYEMASNPAKRQVFIMKTGDWTADVHTALQRNTVRPVWVQGPFTSPYSSAIMFDNQILVASGIGITPALSVIRAQKASRRVNLIWAVRDAAMLEFFIERNQLDDESWSLIFYTGDDPLSLASEELPVNVRIVRGRPDLPSVIPNIIYSIETGEGLPEVGWQEQQLKKDLANLALKMDVTANTPAEQMKQLRGIARDRGYSLAEFCRPQAPGTSSAQTSKFSSKESSRRGVASGQATVGRARRASEASNVPGNRLVRMSGSFNRVHAFDANAESDLLAPSQQEASAAAALKAKRHSGPKVVNIETSSFFSGGLPRLSEATEAEHDEQSSSPAKLSRKETFFALEGLKFSVGLNHQDLLPNPEAHGVSPFRGSPEPNGNIDVPPPVSVTAEVAEPGNPTPATLIIGSLASQQDEHQAGPGVVVADTKAGHAGSVKWGDRSKVSEFPIHKHISFAEEFVLGLDPHALSTWGILYCGGSKPVEQELFNISQKYKIEMSAETFAW